MENTLPKNWVTTELENLCNLVYGKGISVKELTCESSDLELFNVYGANGIIGKYTSYMYENSKVIISCRGAASGVIHKTKPYSFVTSNSIVLDEKSGRLLNLDYLKYVMTEVDKSEVITGTAQPQITIQLLKDLKVALAPLAEQERIVAKLDALFAQQEVMKKALSRIPDLLKDFRQQVLTQAVTGKLLHINEFTELGNLKLEIKTGPFGSALHKSDYIENGIPVINPSHIRNGLIIPDIAVSISTEIFQKLKAYKLFNNDVILGRRGEMGRAALYKQDYGDCLCGTGSIILRCGDNLYPKFLTYYLRSPYCVEYLNTNSVGSTMINLNQKIIKSLRFPNISYLEQQEIVSRVESLLSKADAIEERYKNLKEKIDTLPQAILHKAFKGELVEQLPTDGDAKDLLKDILELKKESSTKKKVVKNYKQNEEVLGKVAEGENYRYHI
ncbi:MAG: restriction endonuclease subunit S [Kaistella sp.]